MAGAHSDKVKDFICSAISAEEADIDYIVNAYLLRPVSVGRACRPGQLQPGQIQARLPAALRHIAAGVDKQSPSGACRHAFAEYVACGWRSGR